MSSLAESRSGLSAPIALGNSGHTVTHANIIAIEDQSTGAEQRTAPHDGQQRRAAWLFARQPLLSPRVSLRVRAMDTHRIAEI